MPLRLSFHGAARTVTGSCFRLETEHGQVLIDAHRLVGHDYLRLGVFSPRRHEGFGLIEIKQSSASPGRFRGGSDTSSTANPETKTYPEFLGQLA